MSINNIGSGSANYTVQQQAQRRTREADAAQKTGGEYDQAKYLRDLNDRLDAKVIAGAWDGKSEFGSENVSTVMVHPDFLRKMHDNPEVGAKYEAEINAYAKSDAESRARLEAQGHRITSSGMSINEKGEMRSYMSGYYNSGGSGGKPEMVKSDDKKSLKEKTEELLERLEEKRQKKKLEAERLAEKDAAQTNVDASFTIDTIA